MNSKRFLIKLQFLGFRYHGVQKQKELPSIQSRIETQLAQTFKIEEFKTRFASRTDAMVSAEETYFLLIFNEAQKLEAVTFSFSKLSPDIQILSTEMVGDSFTILKASGNKKYHYYFAHNEARPHVFSAPFMTILNDKLDINLMMKGAREFLGTHNFVNYSYKPKAGTDFERTIVRSEIIENNILTANFFPQTSYVFRVSSQGFMRGQIRLMMGALFRIGKKELTIDELKQSLKGEDSSFVKWMVPASGLILHKTTINPHY